MPEKSGEELSVLHSRRMRKAEKITRVICGKDS
jgi:hypothetical protein